MYFLRASSPFPKSGIEHLSCFMQVIQEEEAGMHNIVEENTFADHDSDVMPSSPAPYLVSCCHNHCKKHN